MCVALWSRRILVIVISILLMASDTQIDGAGDNGGS